MPLVFVITIFIQNDVQLRQVFRCINSIRGFHDKEHIYLLNETDSEYFETIKHHFVGLENVSVISFNHKIGLGEQHVFDFILNCDSIHEDDNVVYLHDSTVMLKSFQEAENVVDFKPILFFTNHIYHWDTTCEEQTPYNIENGVVTHTDSIIDYLRKHYNQNPGFYDWAMDAVKNRQYWVGVFGYMCIIKKKALRQMDLQIPFATTFLKFPGKRNRVIHESIFSMICNYYFSFQCCVNSLDGLYFNGDGNSIRGFKTPVEGTEDSILWTFKGDYIGKISFAR